MAVYEQMISELSALRLDALQLDKLSDTVFQSRYLWTPPLSKATYGGQLVALCVEAAHQTVDTSQVLIHSAHTCFLKMGDSKRPIVFEVQHLRNGKSFATRLVKGKQAGGTVVCMLAGFHTKEEAGVSHQHVMPSTSRSSDETGTGHARSCEEHLQQLLKKYEGVLQPTDPSGDAALPHRCVGADFAKVQYLNHLMQLDSTCTKEPFCTWMKVEPFSVVPSAPPGFAQRLGLLIACWLMDFTLALAGLLPHEVPNENLRMIASLDHTIRFHCPEEICVEDWFLYEVYSPWADRSRALNRGRMYSRSGKLWLSTSQETLLRMKQGYVSKL